MKQKGRYRFNLRFLKNIPKLVLISTLVMPFYFFGKIQDTITQSGSEIFVVAQKPQRV